MATSEGETDITSQYAASTFAWTQDTGKVESGATRNAAHNGMRWLTMSVADLMDDVKRVCKLAGLSPDYGSV